MTHAPPGKEGGIPALLPAGKPLQPPQPPPSTLTGWGKSTTHLDAGALQTRRQTRRHPRAPRSHHARFIAQWRPRFFFLSLSACLTYRRNQQPGLCGPRPARGHQTARRGPAKDDAGAMRRDADAAACLSAKTQQEPHIPRPRNKIRSFQILHSENNNVDIHNRFRKNEVKTTRKCGGYNTTNDLKKSKIK